MPHRPLITALAFQGGLIVGALLLAIVFGLDPLAQVQISGVAVTIGVAATLPPTVLLIMMPRHRWPWADRLIDVVEQLLESLFANAWPGAVVLVSLLAGLGEELLFRGVIQDGLSQVASPAVALLAASVLFGLAHAVSVAYFVIATAIGIYLGALYMLSDNLFVPMLTHALYDWIAIRYYLRRL